MEILSKICWAQARPSRDGYGLVQLGVATAPGPPDGKLGAQAPQSSPKTLSSAPEYVEGIERTSKYIEGIYKFDFLFWVEINLSGMFGVNQ